MILLNPEARPMHTLFDVVLVALYAVIWLIVEFVRLPRVRASMAAAPPGARAAEYYKTVAVQWMLAGLLFVRLWAGHRPASSIGLNLPHGVLGWVVSAVGCAAMLWLLQQQARATSSERGRAALARQLSTIAWWL